MCKVNYRMVLIFINVTHRMFFFSGCSGLVAATFGTPADVVKTRIMNQPTKNGKYDL